jgi:predicted Fe-Mo cluster-binding NifX family protein
MKIAVATNGETLENLVPEIFEESPCLLIVETDDMSYSVYQNQEDPKSLGLNLAQFIIEQDCEALISGSIESPAFEVLSGAQITRYFGAAYSAIDALDLMEDYQLEHIRVPNGAEWVPHDHREGTCNCGFDDV